MITHINKCSQNFCSQSQNLKEVCVNFVVFVQIAYEFLCRLEEARIWISRCVGEDLPSVGNGVLEDHLRNGVYLAKLAASFAPHIVQVFIFQILHCYTFAIYFTVNIPLLSSNIS